MSTNERRGQVYLALQLQTANGLANLSATEAAVARKAALEDALEIHQRELAQQIQTLWGDAQTLASQVGPVKALLTGSNEVVESYLRQFQVGRKNWLDVLNAQREKTQAQYALADIESPLLLTHAQLLILTGTLTPQNLDTLDE
jgi:adhesin transport system outer membrane protein